MSDLSFRTANRADVPVILSLLNGDAITRAREETAAGEATSESVDARYWAAFEAIDADPRNELIVL